MTVPPADATGAVAAINDDATAVARRMRERSIDIEGLSGGWLTGPTVAGGGLVGNPRAISKDGARKARAPDGHALSLAQP